MSLPSRAYTLQSVDLTDVSATSTSSLYCKIAQPRVSETELMNRDVGCKTVANMIKGKTPEEIRKLFNITNEYVSPHPLSLDFVYRPHADFIVSPQRRKSKSERRTSGLKSEPHPHFLPDLRADYDIADKRITFLRPASRLDWWAESSVRRNDSVIENDVCLWRFISSDRHVYSMKLRVTSSCRHGHQPRLRLQYCDSYRLIRDQARSLI